MPYKVLPVTGSYKTRQELANKANAALYIECHYNSTPGAQGTEVLVTDNASETSYLVARDIAAGITTKFGTTPRHNHGVKPLTSADRGYGNLVHTKMPAVLVEPFFIDSAEWADRAKTEFSKVAQAIYTAVYMNIPDNSVIALSLGHRGNTNKPGDEGAKGGNGMTEASLAELYIRELKRLLESGPIPVSTTKPPASPEPSLSADCPPWAEESRQFALGNKLIQSDSGWTSPVTKAELAVILERFWDMVYKSR